ncbi:hypothetical protein AAFF27_22150 [Xylophilus sp. GW821-FHT01B05]
MVKLFKQRLLAADILGRAVWNQVFLWNLHNGISELALVDLELVSMPVAA